MVYNICGHNLTIPDNIANKLKDNRLSPIEDFLGHVLCVEFDEAMPEEYDEVFRTHSIDEIESAICTHLKDELSFKEKLISSNEESLSFCLFNFPVIFNAAIARRLFTPSSLSVKFHLSHFLRVGFNEDSLSDILKSHSKEEVSSILNLVMAEELYVLEGPTILPFLKEVYPYDYSKSVVIKDR